MRIWRSQTS